MELLNNFNIWYFKIWLFDNKVSSEGFIGFSLTTAFLDADKIWYESILNCKYLQKYCVEFLIGRTIILNESKSYFDIGKLSYNVVWQITIHKYI